MRGGDIADNPRAKSGIGIQEAHNRRWIVFGAWRSRGGRAKPIRQARAPLGAPYRASGLAGTGSACTEGMLEFTKSVFQAASR
jgi:hypothetical protein